MPISDRPAVQRLQPPKAPCTRVNLRGRPEVEVTLMGRRSPAVAELVEAARRDGLSLIYLHVSGTAR